MKRTKLVSVYTIFYVHHVNAANGKLSMATAYAKTEKQALDAWRKEFPMGILHSIKQGHHPLPS